MDQEKLHRFFAGEASMNEGLDIKAWIEASEENKQAFYRERRLFDAILLHRNPREQRRDRHTRLFGWLRVAAIVLITLGLSHLYRRYTAVPEVVAMNTVTAPAGQRTNLTLPDGTEVWLNARTTLQYPTTFNRRQRSVTLKGEAYFEVTKNKEMPFVVHTGRYNVEVLGTHFNVSAYPDSKVFETTLMEGSVRVSTSSDANSVVVLQPHYKAYAENGRLKTAKVEDFDYYRWTEGLICFKDKPFEGIIRELAKCYGMRIVINNRSVLKYSFNGKFRQSDGIDYALHVLQRDIRFSYTRDPDKPIIYIN